MKIKFVSEVNHNRKLVITMPEMPTLLRINKQVGCFASGLIRLGENDSMQQFGHGRWLECAIASIDDDLEGIVGLGNSKRWAFVSAMVTKADDLRIKGGDLVHFLSYGAERTTFTILANKTSSKSPYIVKINFNLSIPTQYGTVIKPPAISIKKPDPHEQQYLEVAKTLAEKYPRYFPDATDLYPAKYDSQTNKLISGLIHLRKPKTLPKVTIKSFSKMFWKS